MLTLDYRENKNFLDDMLLHNTQTPMLVKNDGKL